MAFKGNGGNGKGMLVEEGSNASKIPPDNHSLRLEGENVFRPRYPPTDASNGNAVLLVTSVKETADNLTRKLVSEGYAVTVARTTQEGITNIGNSYLEAVVLDIAQAPDALTFVKQATITNPDLPVMLVDTTNTQRSQLDLSSFLHQGAITFQPDQPFNVAEIAGGRPPINGQDTQYNVFFRTLEDKLAAVKQKRNARWMTVASGLPEGTTEADLSLDVGEAAATIYRGDRLGGSGFQREATAGIATRISQDKVYRPEDARNTFHIKPVKQSEARTFFDTFAALNEIGRGHMTPAPRGKYQRGDFGLITLGFILGSSYYSIHNTLFSPQVPEDKKELAQNMWNAFLTDFFKVQYPEWYRATHPIVMDDHHQSARQTIPQKQIEQMLLFPQNLSAISGKPLSSSDFGKIASAVPALYNRPIPDVLFVLGMDPKGANIGRLTYQVEPTYERLVELSTREGKNGREVDPAKLPPFAHWDNKMIGTVYTILSELWQTLLDPRLSIPLKDSPAYMSQSVEEIFKGTNSDPNSVLLEAWRQGLYKTARKTFVCSVQAAAEVYRLETMKNLDEQAAEKSLQMLQQDVYHFIGQVLNFSSGLHRAILENHAEKGLAYGLEQMAAHFAEPERWSVLEKTTSQKQELVALKAIHEVFTRMRDPNLGLASFDRTHLLDNYGSNKALHY